MNCFQDLLWGSCTVKSLFLLLLFYVLKENSSVILSLLLGEIDPSKKPPPPATRKYDPVGDWTPADGCPDGCKAKIGNYDSLITHRTRCPNRRKPQK